MGVVPVTLGQLGQAKPAGQLSICETHTTKVLCFVHLQVIILTHQCTPYDCWSRVDTGGVELAITLCFT